jgi:aconitate decarboxylase
MVAQFSPQRIAQDDVWALIPRIKAHHDADFDKRGGIGRGAARVRIKFNDGTLEECLKPVSRAVQTPLPADEVVAKFRSLTRDIVEAPRLAQIEDRVLNLEKLRDVKELISLLAAPVQPVFSQEISS